MTQEEIKAKMQEGFAKIKPKVAEMTSIIMDAYEEGFNTCFELLTKPITATETKTPKFKVKYAGKEYNVLEIRNINGVKFYGIEDEPNHIDYVKAGSCKIISGYNIKENGSPYPTKPAVFSEQKPSDKVEPKFKVGDKVRMKEFESFPHICTVEDVDSDVYYCDFTNFDIDDQDGWELVKEPKFKVGDFIVNDYCMGRVVEITNDAYLLDTGQGIPFSCEHNAHLWSISDAKDGDVLAEESCIFIIQKLGDNNTAAKTYCTLYNDGDFEVGSILYFDIDSTKPATKEHCELLFRKMEEAGYAWNPITKELSHISVTKKSDKDCKWAKKDEEIQKCIIEDVEELMEQAPEGVFRIYVDELNWLKDLKQRLS